MRQVDALRGRIGAGGQWLRLGLASATIMAPLLSRWSDLRAAERARVLADEAEARLHDMRGHLNLASLGAKRDPLELVREARAQLGAERSKASTRLWLVGVGVGLVAASAGAYVLVRRRMAQVLEEPLMELPAVSVNGNRAFAQTRPRRQRQRPRRRPKTRRRPRRRPPLWQLRKRMGRLPRPSRTRALRQTPRRRMPRR